MRKSQTLIALLMAATALSACATSNVTPLSRATQTASLPAAYPHATPELTARQASTDPWWRNFGDARLDRLVDQVLAQNYSLASATILVRRAQLQAGLAGDALLPQVTGGGSVSTSRDTKGVTGDNGSANVSVAYVVDLFGRLGAERDAARWEARATEQDLRATALALTGTTVNLYWQLGYLNDRIATGEENLAYARKVLELVNVQHRAGAVSGIEVSEAQQSVQNQETSQSQLIQQRVETRNGLTLLLGGQAWSEADEPQALPSNAAPGLSPGVPADLLARRPDLRAAELRLRSGLSGVDASRASFYPQITLTGGASGASTDLGDILSNPVATLGVGVTLPFLNWNQNRLNLRISEADYEKSVLDFRQTLLTALQDTDNALSSITQLTVQTDRGEAALASATRAANLYELRYRSGAVALRIWLDAQQSQRTNEQSLAQTRLAQLQAYVTLYQALGGGTGTLPPPAKP